MPGIKDRVAVAGVGYTRYGERWESDAEDLLVEAVDEACADAGIEQSDIDAIWVGIFYPFSGMAGTGAADPLKIFGKPATRVENYCASGMDAFRNACYAVASGVVDVALACGVEKITDQGGTGLPAIGGRGHPVMPTPSAPAMFALAATRSFHVHGWTKEDLAQVAVKNHANGVHHPKAHFRRAITVEQAVSAPIVAWPLGRFDCCAVSDGAAAVIITRPETAKNLAHADDFVRVKANALAVHTAWPMFKSSMDYLGFPATRDAAALAYEEAGVKDPAREISFAEVHDCFTITEILNYQDLGFCKEGEGVHLLREGQTSPGGSIPVNVSGGLKCFGHPIGSTGCRMIVESTKQLQGRADGVQVADATLGLAHNLGGPGAVCSVTILGRNDV
ncbi:MAG TPA: acetyl-CoA acetyltransferase [Actinomycetota bacterium]|nr:acetyl-CoA acetyltransferase [Actinomycetota bacterium]